MVEKLYTQADMDAVRERYMENTLSAVRITVAVIRSQADPNFRSDEFALFGRMRQLTPHEKQMDALLARTFIAEQRAKALEGQASLRRRGRLRQQLPKLLLLLSVAMRSRWLALARSSKLAARGAAEPRRRSMYDFRRLAVEALEAPPVVVKTPVVGIGSDAPEFETLIPRDDAAGLAAAIIAAGKARVSGHTLSTEMSPLAEAIVAAGEKRRGKFDGFS
jgi:hypothetical protein